MEAMEIEPPVEGQAGRSRLSGSAAAAGRSEDTGSSTEVDEDEDEGSEGAQTAVRVQPRLPATWAFSQRAAGGGAVATQPAAPGAPIRRRLR